MITNSVSEDRERCIVVGMDDFYTQPIKPDLLFAVLLSWSKRKSRAPLGSVQTDNPTMQSLKPDYLMPEAKKGIWR